MPGFKYGRIARDTSRWAPALEDYLRAGPASGVQGLEPVADSEDVNRATLVYDWPLYCERARRRQPARHPRTASGTAPSRKWPTPTPPSASTPGKPQVLFADAAVIRRTPRRLRVRPGHRGNDNGCQMQDVLAYQRTTGMTDADGNVHKVIAYAALRNPADIGLLSRVLKTFGYVFLGINCPASAQDQFGNEPWTYVAGSPIEGGHAIGLHRRQPYGSRVGVFEMATWGALQPTTIGFIQHFTEEAWAVITEDWLEANGSTCDGVSLSQLRIRHAVCVREGQPCESTSARTASSSPASSARR